MADINGPVLPPPPAAPAQNYVVAVAVIVTIGALYVGAGIFVPLVLAVLLTFALAPIVRMLHKLRVPHVLAVLLAVIGAAILIGTLAFLIVTQLARLAVELPQYQQIVSEKFRALQSLGGGEVFERIASTIQGIGAPAAASPEVITATPVTVVNPPESPFAFVQMFLTALLGPLATAAIVTVFVVFLLLEHGDFRDRFLKLVSRGDLRTSTKVVNEAGKRVSRYLLVQFSVNLSYGIIFGLGMFLIGVPNPVLWGLFAGIFRYIPFVGTLIAASIPFSLAFAIDPGWGMLLSAVGLFVCLELVITNAIEPRLYGSSTGLSALAVIVAAMFWATLWGPIGLILATPLTVCLVVLGRYVPQLNFLEILLGSEPVLVREEQLYQRLLSGNIEEAIEIGETYIERNYTDAFFDDIAFPALRLAEADRVRNLTDVSSRRLVADGMAALVHEFEPEETSDEATPTRHRLNVLCIGGRTELDGAAASMLSQVIDQTGVSTKVLPPISVRPESIGHLDLAGVDVVCLAYLDASPRTFAKFVAKRIKRRNPKIKIIACFLNAPTSGVAEDLGQLGIDHLAGNSMGAKAWILAQAQQRNPVSSEQDANDLPDHLGWVIGLQRLVKSGKPFDAMITDINAKFGSAMAIVSLADDEHDDHAGDDETGQSHAGIGSLSDRVIAASKPLVIEDATQDATHAGNAFLLVNDIRFYAGVPLLTASGDPVGALSIMGHDARRLQPMELLELELAAAAVMDAVTPVGVDPATPAPVALPRTTEPHYG